MKPKANKKKIITIFTSWKVGGVTWWDIFGYTMLDAKKIVHEDVNEARFFHLLLLLL